MGGYFTEGNSPSANSIVTFLHWDVDAFFEDHIVPSEDEYFTTYHIPAEEYEALVFSYFTKSDAITTELRTSPYYIADGGYHEIVTGGGFGDMIPDFNYYGFEKLDDGSYIAYATLTSEYLWDQDSFDYVKYTPGANEVEGKDYIYVPMTWLPNNDDFLLDSLDNVEVTHGYIPTIHQVRHELRREHRKRNDHLL